MGEYVDGAAQKYSAIKFRVRGPRWQPDDSEATCAYGRLRLSHNETRWFEFIPATPQTLRQLEYRVLNSITTLTSLVTRGPAVELNLQVKVDVDSAWRDVHRGEKPVESESDTLLDTTHLTAERFANWIDLRARTDALDAAAIDELDGVAIQTEVLTLGAIAEGLHHRLFDEKKRIPEFTDNHRDKTRRKARQAALELRTDPPFTDADREEFQEMMQDAFSHINDQTFRSRMADLIADAQTSIPNIAAAFDDWPDAVSSARNTLAHEGTNRREETQPKSKCQPISFSTS